jgi:phosphate starvation-inducible PhoH-like protein
MAKGSNNTPRTRKTKQEQGEVRQVAPKFQEQRKQSIKPLVAKNDRQKQALKAFSNRQLLVLSGAAGVGKTELMVWWACKRWLDGDIDNIVITRPYQHLGADYGATKGNDSEKLLPFCMSMLSKMRKYLGAGVLSTNFRLDGFETLFAEADGIQIIPIEKIQGMSFNERTIILADELQNASVAQVKALTTRAEEGCQIIASGDARQTAIGKNNGLCFIEKVLAKYPTEYAEVVTFLQEDIVRGGLTAHLVSAFDKESEVW